MFYIRVFSKDMRIEWSQTSEVSSTLLSAYAKHVLVVFEEKFFSSLPFADALALKLQRAGLTAADLKDKPVTLELADGTLVSLCQVEATASAFGVTTLLRTAIKPLLSEHPARIALAILSKKTCGLTRQIGSLCHPGECTSLARAETKNCQPETA